MHFQLRNAICSNINVNCRTLVKNKQLLLLLNICFIEFRVRKVVAHPTEHSWILSSVQGNNEISMWNLETGCREKVLWGSKAPPLSKNPVSISCFNLIIINYCINVEFISTKSQFSEY